MFAVQRFYHASPALSTPHWRSLGHPHPPHLPLSYGDFQGLENAISYTMHILIPSMLKVWEQLTKLSLSQTSHGKEKFRMLFDLIVGKHDPIPLEEEKRSDNRVLNQSIMRR